MDKTKQAVEVFDKLAKLYQEKYMDVNMYADSLNTLCELAENNAFVLELGCGPGNVTKYILDKRPDLKVLGTDLAPNMLELARENNPNAVFSLMDSRNLSELNKTYDVIVSAFVLPYLSKKEAINLICNASNHLCNKGLFYLSFIEDNNEKSAPRKGSQGDEVYMNYHEESYIMEALTESSFDLINKWRISYPGPDNKPVTDLVILTKLRGKSS